MLRWALIKKLRRYNTGFIGDPKILERYVNIDVKTPCYVVA